MRMEVPRPVSIFEASPRCFSSKMVRSGNRLSAPSVKTSSRKRSTNISANHAGVILEFISLRGKFACTLTDRTASLSSASGGREGAKILQGEHLHEKKRGTAVVTPRRMHSMRRLLQDSDP